MFGLARRTKLALSLTGAILLTACAPGAVAPSSAPADAGPTGTMTVAMPGDIVSIDPQINLLALDQSILFPNLYDQLLWYDFKGVKQGRLLSEWKQVSPTVWEFKLRSGVKFHNGEVWNAQALAANWIRKLDSGGPRHTILEGLSKHKLDVIDDLNVRITTATPVLTLLDDMAVLFILPPAHLKQVGDAGFAKAPIGTGAFKFVEWVKGDHLTLEANPDYWAGAPKIKTLILKPIPEVSTRVSALRTGEVDFIMAVPPDQADSLKTDEKLSVVSAGINGAVYIELFPDSPKGGGKPLADVRVRHALSYAINVDDIIKFVLKGYAKRAATIINSQAFGHDPSVTPYPYDPVKAKQLLTEAGYPNGFTIGWDLASLGLPSDLQVMQAVMADWAKVGVKVEVNQMDTAAIVPLKTGFKIAPVFFWNYRGFDADGIGYVQWHTGQAFFYYAGHTPEVDKLLEDQRNSTDPNTRIALWKQIQAKVKADQPYIALYEPMAVYGINKRVVGFEPQPKDTVNLRTASIKK